MQPNITRVRWSAENVPWGMSFDEKTGTFSGTPEDAGEYIVPVTVETNYGKDTKDVKIMVTPPTYRVYAIGQKAVAWSENAESDTYGFYELDIPKAYKLTAQYDGFGALTEENGYYCCGHYGVEQNRYGFGKIEDMIVSNQSKPKTLLSSSMYIGCKRIIFGKAHYAHTEPNRTYPVKTTEEYYFSILLKPLSLSGIGDVDFYDTFSVNFGSGMQKQTRQNDSYFPQNNYTLGITVDLSQILSSVQKLELGNAYMFSDACYLDAYSSFRCLGGNGTKVLTITFRGAEGTGVTRRSVSPYFTIEDLGYKAEKFLNGKFSCLSDTHYLDNNPDNFTQGIIKNVWSYGTSIVYVQTTVNRLYDYVSSSNTWRLLGTYDIKKIELPDTNHIFLLTDDGKLYHKGNSVTGVFDEAHENLTHVFPELTFKDFTFGGNTLTVLRE